MNSATVKARPTPKQTEARLKAARKNPCFTCASQDCETCINSPENSVPIRLYTPKSAARAMLVGNILRDHHGWQFYWQDYGPNAAPGFFFKDEKGDCYPVNDFSGLYEEQK